MKKIIFLLLVAVAFSCTTKVVKETRKEVRLDSSSVALSKFIEGNIYEMKGNFGDAIVKYEEALQYDKSAGIYYAIAKNCYRINRLAPALTNAKSAVQLDSSNTEYLYLLATIYDVSHMDDSSAAVYKKIIEIEPNNINAYYNLAQLYEANKPLEAIKIYKKLISSIGPEWHILVRLTELNEKIGNQKETVETLEELARLNPSNLDLQKLLIDAYTKSEQYDKASKLCDELLLSYPFDVGLLQQKGNIYIKQDNWKEAALIYQKIFDLNDLQLTEKLQLASLFYAAADKDSNNIFIARDFLKKIDKDTSDWQVNAYLGEIELKLGNDSVAIEYFRKAAKLAEWNAQIWIRAGGLLFDSRKYDETIEFMSEAAEKFPNDFVVNLIYGLALSQTNRHQEAKIYLKRAININSDDVTALSAYGYTLNQLKENNEALQYLNKALLLQPDNVDLIGTVAMIYESEGNYKMSDSLYQHALGLDSSNAIVLNNYAYSLAERNIRLNEALKMASKAIENDPKNSSFLDTIGWIYFRLGDYQKAKDYIEKSLSLEPNNETVVDHLGDIYFMLGNKTKAMEYWKKAYDINGNNKKIKEKIEKGEI
ncbi:tetratricopeptide repeat protein [Melioribacter sp. OK-6-Me]|uniref:tetratricopeptide repeat protein n=1 Tax=unclassified Melioribacter TaxID=2627329 RepID=UPI003ED8E5AE